MADNLAWTPGSGATIRTDDLGAAGHVQYMKLMDGTDNSSAVIPGDATNGLDVDVTRIADRAANGNAGSVATVFTMTDLQGMSTAIIQATAWGVATVIIEASGDAGTTWTAVNIINTNTGAITTTGQITANGLWEASVAGFTQLRARCSVFTSGTNTVNIRVSAGAAVVALESPLPAGTNVIGALSANQSVNLAQVNGAGTINGGIAGTLGVGIVDRSGSGNATSVATLFTLGDLQGMGTAVVQATAWTTATVVIEGSGDAGTTWTALNLVNTTTGAITTSITAAGLWMVDLAGFTQLRARCSAFTSGTNTVNVRCGQAQGLVNLANPLPAGTNTIGNIGTIATSVTPGTAAANLGKAEDAVHASGDTGVAALAVSVSDANSLTTTSSAAGDYDVLHTDTRGLLLVRNRAIAVRNKVASAGLTTSVTAYSVGDQLGTIMTFAGCAHTTGGTGTIVSAVVLDKNDIMGDVRLHIFRSTVTLATDNAAFTISDADMDAYIGMIQMPTLIDVGANRVSTAAGIGLGYDCAATSLFVAMETRTAHTFFTAVTDIAVTLHVVLD